MKVKLIGISLLLILGVIGAIGYFKYSDDSNKYTVKQKPKELKLSTERRQGEQEAKELPDLPEERETALLPVPKPPEPEPEPAPSEPEPEPEPIVKIPEVLLQTAIKEEKEPEIIIPLSLPTSGGTREKPFIRSERWLPSHRLIPCRLVTTIETRNLQSPVIAMITEDVYHHNTLVIPAMTEIHSTVGGSDRDGERVTTEREWRIVFHQGKDNGKELTFSALPLHRSDDGVETNSNLSAGLVGRLYEKDPKELAKLLVLAGVQEAVDLAEESIADGDRLSVGSAASDASQGPINQWINRNLDRLGDDPYYLRVAGGTAFYLYTLEPIDIAHAEIGAQKSKAQRR